PSLTGITWSRLENENAVTYPGGREIIFTEGFPTATGRAKIVPTKVTPPAELPDADYPMVLSTGRLLEHWHTGAMTRRATQLDALEPEAIAMLHPRDAARMGIQAGEKIRVSTRRGTITLKARLDRDVAENMVFIPFAFFEAAANLLTNPQLDPFGKIPEFKFCAARVEAQPETVAAE
ncbi:MAG: molybdopterin dinucleotide binding domain-containing protein, partial [Ferrovibrio sp.]